MTLLLILPSSLYIELDVANLRGKAPVPYRSGGVDLEPLGWAGQGRLAMLVPPSMQGRSLHMVTLWHCQLE